MDKILDEIRNKVLPIVADGRKGLGTNWRMAAAFEFAKSTGVSVNTALQAVELLSDPWLKTYADYAEDEFYEDLRNL